MIRVANQKIITLLSKRSLKSNRQRNVIALCAIMLTAILFTTLCTIGSSLVASMQRSTMRQVGMSAHGGYKFLSQQQYDKLLDDPKITALSYNIILGNAQNKELQKLMTEVRYTEEKDAEWSFHLPTVGRLPQSGMELATSTAVLDAFGLPHELGVTLTLEILVNDEVIEDTFTLCGYWESDMVAMAEEAYVSREYSDQVAPVKQTAPHEDIATWRIDNMEQAGGTINPSIWFDNAFDIEGQMDALSARCGFDMRYVKSGVNWAYATSTMDFQFISMIVSFVLLIGAAGYLIIYNIFSISVSRDIRYYGLLKTIGTTGRQIKRLVRRQALLLCVGGIPAGLLLGYLCAALLMPMIVSNSSIANDYIVSTSPLVFIGAAVFTLLTVWISCIRPCRYAASVSPIEAVRFTDMQQRKKRKTKKTGKVSPFGMAIAGLARSKKKVGVTVLSLALSMIVLNTIYTLVNGFDINLYVQNNIVTDFSVTDASITNLGTQFNVQDGVTQQMLEDIAALPQLESMGSIYMREYEHILSDKAAEKAKQGIEAIRQDYSAETLQSVEQKLEQKEIAGHIYGIDQALLDTMQLNPGQELDTEKFLSGDYVIVTGIADGDFINPIYEIGDKVSIDFGEGKQKEYTVLAIGDIPYALGPLHGHIVDLYFTLPAEEYIKQTSAAQPLRTAFNVKDEAIASTEKWLENYCENIETNLDYTSREQYVEEFHDFRMMMVVVGGILSGILGFIGILNFINTIMTSVFARRREIAMLQAVGMTQRQVQHMLAGEGFCYAALTTLFSVTFGSLMGYYMIKTIARGMWYFVYHFTLVPIFVCLPFFIAVAILVPLLCCRSLSRQSIVERLGDTAE